MMRYAGLLLFGLLLAGCGYHSPQAGDSWVGGDARILYVDLFDNRASEPYLENYITDQVVFQFSRSRMVSITEKPANAEVVLSGTVEDFDTKAIAYNREDRITEYRARITVVAKLKRTRDGQILWQDRLTSSEDFPAAVDKNLQLEVQDLAAREVSRRLGEDLYAQMFNAF